VPPPRRPYGPDVTQVPADTIKISPLSGLGSTSLLVLSPAEEIAKRIESHLRNAGHPVRCIWVTDLEDLEDVVRRSPPDVVLATDSIAPGQVLGLMRRLDPDLPVLIIGKARSALADALPVMAAGARDLVVVGDDTQLKHLELVCVRELLSGRRQRELRTTRARLADYETRHKKLVAGTVDAVVHVQEGIVTDANGPFAALLGYESESALDGSPLMDLVAPESQPKVKQFLRQFGQGKPTEPVLELALHGPDGRTVKVEAQVAVGEAGGDRLLELLIHAEAKPAPPPPPAPAPPRAAPAPAPPAPAAAPAAAGRLELFEAVTRAIKGDDAAHYGLLFVAVDSFAAVEERLGSRDAEQAVAHVADVLRTRSGGKDTVFRFSTSELALVTARPKPTEFVVLAEQLKKEVASQIVKTENAEMQLTVTVVTYPLSAREKPNDAVEATLREARRLSQQGGNRSAVIGATAQAAQAEAAEQKKADQVKKALSENRIKLAYQSIASLEGDSRQHFDVLARMLDESGQEIPAKEFIPAAEKFGLITAIDRWVIGRSLTVLAKRQNAADASSLFVRLSEHTLKEGDAFVKWLMDQLKARPLRKEELVFSIQEPILEVNLGKARALATALRKAGAELAVDYFGVGNASAKLLEHIPASFVRLHYSFTKNFNDPVLQKKMSELIEVAKERKIRTIVGQVEDANAMARLWQMGVNYIQGFHIQAPEAVLLSTDLPR